MTRLACAGLAALVLACLPAAPAAAAAVPVTDSGAAAADIQATVESFATVLGPLNENAAGTVSTGRREIDWDDVPDASANPLPRDFFNSTSPRGVLFSSPTDLFRVSDSFSGFTPFSPTRMLATLDATVMTVDFLVPGTSRPATVSGFGAVFADVDALGDSYVKAYGEFGQVLAVVDAPDFNDGLSFAGVTFDAGERIERVEIGTGNAPLGSPDNGPSDDKVVLDDFIYGEPGQPRLSVSDATIAEGDEGTRDVTFTVTRDIDTQTAFTVPYATLSDGADEGQDYIGKAGTIAFNSGVASREVTVAVKGDKTDEPDEGLKLLLLDDGQATLADGEGRAVIADDDPTPVIVVPVTPTPTATPDTKRPSIAVKGMPKRCARRDFTATLTITEDNLASLRVRLDKTTLSDRATLSAVRERLRVRIPAGKLRRGKHSLLVTARDKAGNRRIRTVRFRRC